MGGAQGRSVRIDLGKRTRELAIITRTGKFKANERRDDRLEDAPQVSACLDLTPRVYISGSLIRYGG
jgi:hypothetical protein